MSFESLNLCPELLKAIKESGFTTPTSIQLQAIPAIVAGKDLLASSNTGTGKTATFILPALNLLQSDKKKSKGPRVLILVPTRELAMQVAKESIKFSQYIKFAKTVCIYGGVPYRIQQRQLARPYEVLIATPGRLIDFLQQGKITLSQVEMFILDEADRMLDMGFIHAVKEIVELLPAKRQTLMFSATLGKNIKILSKNILSTPVEINSSKELSDCLNICQRLYNTKNLSHKHQLLKHFLSDPELNQAIIFTSTKSFANQLVQTLIEDGFSADALHGDMNQRQRTRCISKFHDEKIKILVATDVAARGIDVKTISHVINFDIPNNPEDYVHRIGRTGRAGNTGFAFSLVSSQEISLVKRIEKFTGLKIDFQVVPGMEPPVNSSPTRTNKRPRGKPFSPSNFRRKSSGRVYQQ